MSESEFVVWRISDDVSDNFPFHDNLYDEAELGEPGPAIVEEELPRSTTVRPLPPIPRSTSATSGDEQTASQAGEMASNNNNAFPALDTSFGNRAPGPTTGSHANGAGINNMPNYVAGMPVGHQQDLNYLMSQIQDLSSILAANREKVNDITRSAEEVARRANSAINGQDGDWDHDSDQARIRELEHSLAQANKVIDLYKHEQRENTNLIAQYEDALGTATEQIRNYCNDIDSRFIGQRRHYNNLLQAEKDEHFKSRLDRDHWHATTLELCEMIRTANRLRNDEWCDEYRVVVGLQHEVRCFRRVLGLEAQKPEEETGWPYLQDAPLNEQA